MSEPASFPGSEDTAPQLDFFISYTAVDEGWGTWIDAELRKAGYSSFLQKWDIRPGSNFVLEMQKGTSARATVLVLSREYLASGFAAAEWSAAFVQDATGAERKVIPIRVRPCQPAGLLKAIVYRDLIGLAEDEARAALLDAVDFADSRPLDPIPFPGGRTIAAPGRMPAFPGALPAIWNVPHRRNPAFTGREQLLRDLHDALRSGKPAAITQAITGMGGAGKTQFATEYTYRHAADYSLVWWLKAEEPATLASDYAALARELDLPEKDAHEQARHDEAAHGAEGGRAYDVERQTGLHSQAARDHKEQEVAD